MTTWRNLARTAVLRILLQVTLLLCILTAWELLGSAGGRTHPSLISSPSLVTRAFVAYASEGLLVRDTIATSAAALLGLAAGTLLGIISGLLLSQLPQLRRVLDPFIVAVNSLPRPALAPVLILWFGIGILPKAILSASLVFFIVFHNVVAGVATQDQDLVRVLRSMRATRTQTLVFLTLPTTLTWVAASLQTAVSYSFVGAVIGEFMGSSVGLGYRIVLATNTFHLDLAFAILVWLMVLGVVLTKLSSVIERPFNASTSGGQHGAR